ncbi:MAG: AAA family ATPase, partial [Rhodospirillaceae bacterium]|nr:AAA family ATPase [Rhodospirillaceae bacterium]
MPAIAGHCARHRVLITPHNIAQVFGIQYLGDGVLAYFGWPQAYEDQAERSVRAGLDAIAAVAAVRLADNVALAARVGIATGQVVVGDLVGESGRDTEAVTGETPNLAARLQGVAEPGQVVISETTLHLVRQAFAVDDLGRHEMKGFDDTVQAWTITGEVTAESRFDAARGAVLTDIVGREAELQMLFERWLSVEAGDGQVVLLSGEAGIGKSRLLQDLRDRVSEHVHVRVRYQCSPYHTNSALHPTIQHWARAAGFTPDDDGAGKLDKLEALLAETTDDFKGDAPLFANLLSLPFQERHGGLTQSPQEIKERLLNAQVSHVLNLAKLSPVLFLFEDVHWIDPTSLELLKLIIERLRNARVLLVITHRPDWQPNFADSDHMTTLELRRLGKAQGAEIVRAIVGDKISDDVVNRIVERTDGVPLYIEELTRAVLGANEMDATNGTSGPINIPESLQDSLMERLDQLGDAKEVAQVGSAIGREFSYQMTAAVIPQSEQFLQESLLKLAESGVVFERGVGREARYVFRHALVQEAAHGSMLISRRRSLHLAIAQALVSLFPDMETLQPELLARHYDLAEHYDEAIKYFELAGRKASAASANAEAIAHFQYAIDRLPDLSVADDNTRQKIEFGLRAALGVPLIALKGYASKDVEDNYLRAQSVAGDEIKTETYFAVLRGLWNCYFDRGDIPRGHELSAALLSLAQELDNDLLLSFSYRAVGSVHMMSGNITQADITLESGFAARQRWQGDVNPQAYSEDPGLACAYYLGCTRTAKGQVDAGLGYADTALTSAREMGRPIGIAFAEAMRAIALAWLNEYEELQSSTSALEAYCTEHQLVFWTAWARFMRGWSMVHLSAADKGIVLMREGMAQWLATGAALHIPTQEAMIMEACLTAGRNGEAAQAGENALRACGLNGENLFLSEILRLQGVSAHRAGDADGAMIHFQSAIDEAAKNGAGLFELRAMMSLVDVLQERNQHKQAAEGLARCLAKVDRDSNAAFIVAARKLYAAMNDGQAG